MVAVVGGGRCDGPRSSRCRGSSGCSRCTSLTSQTARAIRPSVHGRVDRPGGHPGQLAGLPAQHPRPQPERVVAEQVGARPTVRRTRSPSLISSCELLRRPSRRSRRRSAVPAAPGRAIAVGVSRSTMPDVVVEPAEPDRLVVRSVPDRPSEAPTASAESVLTGPPWNSTSGAPASVGPARAGSPPTGTVEGRLSTTPSAPSSSRSSSSTTVRSKFGSSSVGVATSRSPTATRVSGRGQTSDVGTLGERSAAVRTALRDGGVHVGVEDARDDVVRVQLVRRHRRRRSPPRPRPGAGCRRWCAPRRRAGRGTRRGTPARC